MKFFDKEKYSSSRLKNPASLRILWGEMVVSLDKAITAITIIIDGNSKENDILKKEIKVLEHRLNLVELQLKKD